jgi:potassium uptake Trk family protein
LLYASADGKLTYIDALFFGTGANTQAGLNPVDVNLLNTFQQVVIFICAMTSNPITINSCVVFLRLFWFEKRFQHIVKEARSRRPTISKTKSRFLGGDELEKGVNGRNITVMHNGAKSRITNDGILLDPRAETIATERPSASRPPVIMEDEGVDPLMQPVTQHESRRPEIKFAQTVKRSDGVEDETTKLPPRLANEDHIAILERQRDDVDDEVLRIPGPRESERGALPKRVSEGEAEEPEQKPAEDDLQREIIRNTDARTGGRHPTIQIEEPDRPDRSEELAEDARAFAHVFTPLKLRKPRLFNKKQQRYHEDDDDDNHLQATPSAISKTSRRRQTFDHLRTVFSSEKAELAPYLSWEPTLGRNSAFPGLTEEQREELGGIEYRSLKTLALVLTFYFWFYWGLSVVCLTPWIKNNDFYGQIVDAAGQSRVWWGFFTGNSAFMDLGFTLTADSMNSFNTAVFPLLLMSFLIVIGNTGFPIMLRFMIWLFSVCVPRGTGLYEELRFLLDHPRRCFTLLFPAGATWWLFWLLVILNGLDLIFFIVLDVSRTVLFWHETSLTGLVSSEVAWLMSCPLAFVYLMACSRHSRRERLGFLSSTSHLFIRPCRRPT